MAGRGRRQREMPAWWAVARTAGSEAIAQPCFSVDVLPWQKRRRYPQWWAVCRATGSESLVMVPRSTVSTGLSSQKLAFARQEVAKGIDSIAANFFSRSLSMSLFEEEDTQKQRRLSVPVTYDQAASTCFRLALGCEGIKKPALARSSCPYFHRQFQPSSTLAQGRRRTVKLFLCGTETRNSTSRTSMSFHFGTSRIGQPSSSVKDGGKMLKWNRKILQHHGAGNKKSFVKAVTTM